MALAWESAETTTALKRNESVEYETGVCAHTFLFERIGRPINRPTKGTYIYICIWMYMYTFVNFKTLRKLQKLVYLINFDPFWACRNIKWHGRIILVSYGLWWTPWINPFRALPPRRYEDKTSIDTVCGPSSLNIYCCRDNWLAKHRTWSAVPEHLLLQGQLAR